MQGFRFTLEALKNLTNVGSIAPSSKFLIREIIKNMNFSDSKVIIELGSGDGCITKALLDNMNQNSKLLCFETNNEFFEKLKSINDPRLILINDSAEKIETYIDKYQLNEANYIVSSLPLAVLPKKVENKVISSSFSSLCRGGTYIQYQYSLISYTKLKKIYNDIKLGFSIFNFPPAFVYFCKKTN